MLAPAPKPKLIRINSVQSVQSATVNSSPESDSTVFENEPEDGQCKSPLCSSSSNVTNHIQQLKYASSRSLPWCSVELILSQDFKPWRGHIVRGAHEPSAMEDLVGLDFSKSTGILISCRDALLSHD